MQRTRLTAAATLAQSFNWKLLVWLLALGAGTWLALIPAAQAAAMFSFWDKAQHAFAYAVLAVLGLWAFPQRRVFVLLALAAHGGLIELLQAGLTTTRQGEWADWLADLLGLLLVAVLAQLLGRLRQHKR